MTTLYWYFKLLLETMLCDQIYMQFLFTYIVEFYNFSKIECNKSSWTELDSIQI